MCLLSCSYILMCIPKCIRACLLAVSCTYFSTYMEFKSTYILFAIFRFNMTNIVRSMCRCNKNSADKTLYNVHCIDCVRGKISKPIASFLNSIGYPSLSEGRTLADHRDNYTNISLSKELLEPLRDSKIVFQFLALSLYVCVFVL